MEDDAVLRSLLAEILTPDYEVFAACDGAEAISSAQSQEFDLLLTDFRLPDIDGLQVARRIRDTNRNIKIVLHTASILPALPAALGQPHIDIVVRKGLAADELRSVLATLLDAAHRSNSSLNRPVSGQAPGRF